MMVRVRIKVRVTWMGLFGLFFHNPLSEFQKKGRKYAISELGVWPISKKLIGPYE